LKYNGAKPQTPSFVDEQPFDRPHLIQMPSSIAPVSKPLNNTVIPGYWALPNALAEQQVPIHHAMPGPYFSHALSTAQQVQATTLQQTIQKNLFASSATAAAAVLANAQIAQTSNYFNNYKTVLGKAPITINAANTYVSEVPQRLWPSSYQANQDWTLINSMSLGGKKADSNWLLMSWLAFLGPRPIGVICTKGYFPTPWTYVTWINRWSLFGQAPIDVVGPPPDYKMPISVEVIEPMHAGNQTTNQAYIYNAFYNEPYGSYGYTNRQGFFVMLNPIRTTPPEDHDPSQYFQSGPLH
jgi:hypothetical protein